MLLQLLQGAFEFRTSSFSNYWNKLSSNSNNKNMLQVVATGACYPPVATTGSYYAQNLKSLEFENHKN